MKFRLITDIEILGIKDRIEEYGNFLSRKYNRTNRKYSMRNVRDIKVIAGEFYEFCADCSFNGREETITAHITKTELFGKWKRV